MGVITHTLGWQWVFWFMGALGLVLTAFWPGIMHQPREHPRANQAEVDHIAQGGGLVDLDRTSGSGQAVRWSALGQLLRNRMMLGIYLGQYCINVLTWFFITWFPLYLVKQRGMTILQVGFVAAIPALCGLAGGLLGGVFSDLLLKRGCTLTVARKTPIVTGLLLSVSMVACNYVIPASLMIWTIAWIMAGRARTPFRAAAAKGLAALPALPR